MERIDRKTFMIMCVSMGFKQRVSQRHTCIINAVVVHADLKKR